VTIFATNPTKMSALLEGPDTGYTVSNAAVPFMRNEHIEEAPERCAVKPQFFLVSSH
jgi:hypothetical protein